MIFLFNDLYGSANTNRSATGLGLNCCQASHKHTTLLITLTVNNFLQSGVIHVQSQALTTTMKPIVSIYKQAIKIMDQKPMKWHHCRILRKHNLLTFENVINLSILKLFFKCLNNHGSTLLSEVAIRRQSSHRATTRASTCGDCLIPQCKTSFCQSALSVKGAKLWISLSSNQRPIIMLLTKDSNSG